MRTAAGAFAVVKSDWVKLDRSYGVALKACNAGDQAACTKARSDYAQIQQLSPGVPVESR